MREGHSETCSPVRLQSCSQSRTPRPRSCRRAVARRPPSQGEAGAVVVVRPSRRWVAGAGGWVGWSEHVNHWTNMQRSMQLAHGDHPSTTAVRRARRRTGGVLQTVGGRRCALRFAPPALHCWLHVCALVRRLMVGGS